MAIVKSVRVVAAKAGSVLDQDDRKLLGQGVVLSGGALVVVAIAGFAVRVFLMASGLG